MSKNTILGVDGNDARISAPGPLPKMEECQKFFKGFQVTGMNVLAIVPMVSTHTESGIQKGEQLLEDEQKQALDFGNYIFDVGPVVSENCGDHQKYAGITVGRYAHLHLGIGQPSNFFEVVIGTYTVRAIVIDANVIVCTTSEPWRIPGDAS